MPTLFQLFTSFIIIALTIVPFVLYESQKRRRQVAKSDRALAERAVRDAIEETKSPNRQRWIERDGEEAVSFIYLLLGRQGGDPRTSNLIWLEFTMRMHVREVTVFHTPDIDPKNHDYFMGTVDTLRANGMVVKIVETDTQPNLEHTGVHKSEIEV